MSASQKRMTVFVLRALSNRKLGFHTISFAQEDPRRFSVGIRNIRSEAMYLQMGKRTIEPMKLHYFFLGIINPRAISI